MWLSKRSQAAEAMRGLIPTLGPSRKDGTVETRGRTAGGRGWRREGYRGRAQGNFGAGKLLCARL